MGLRGYIKNRIKALFSELRFKIREGFIVGNIAIEEYLNRQLHENPKYQDEKRLNKYEYQVYSQNGEDGIIAEIFRRIGTTNRIFVEIGVGNGLECNTTFLLLKDWAGCWIEKSKRNVKRIEQKFGSLIKRKSLSVKCAFVRMENVETLFKGCELPEDFDLLSIDVDGNDYWIWKAIENYHPRVVVIEYNGFIPPDTEWITGYDPESAWNGTCWFGASLKSLELLGSKKGYRLVCCDFRGVNAFFVREDLAEDKFLEPATAENIYEPFRYHLKTKTGHPRDFGEFEH